MKKKVGVISLGCPKNLVDSEIMLGALVREGFELTNDEDEAEVLVINTCGFIGPAKQESVNTILEMVQYKKSRCERIIVTGCLAERYRDEILREIPEVDAVVGTCSYGAIAQVIRDAYDTGGNRNRLYCGGTRDIGYLDGDRVLSTPPGYAYLKIAEGCDHFCTYCIIPHLRGRYMSRKMEDVVTEAGKLAEKGVKEIILVAQDTTRYGIDLYGERKLVELLKRICSLDGIEWVRILYSYPEEIDDRLIEEIDGNRKICKYMDIPVQHASDRILKAMGRRGDSRNISRIIRLIREKIADVVIRTSLIVGFPGEDQEDFECLAGFVKEHEFDRLGVFEYSREEGTPAARLGRQVGKKVKQERLRAIMAMQKQIAERKNALRVGRQYKTLVEGVSEDGIFYTGRTYAEAPDIDGSIYFTSPMPLKTGLLVNVRIVNAKEYDLIGVVENESAE